MANSDGGTALDQMNTMVVETRWGDREFQLFRGDITKLNFPVDLMVISSIGSNFDTQKPRLSEHYTAIVRSRLHG